MALPQPKADLTEARLAGLTLTETGWTGAARRDALARLRQMGLPTARDEYWKFTRPETLTQPEAPAAAVFDSSDTPIFDDLDRVKVVFVDGVFDAAASDDLALDGVTIERLADAAGADIHWATELYGTLEAKGQTPVQRPLAALNTAFATDGLLIHVTGKPAKPIHLVHIHGDDASDAILHNVIKVDAVTAERVPHEAPRLRALLRDMEELAMDKMDWFRKDVAQMRALDQHYRSTGAQ